MSSFVVLMAVVLNFIVHSDCKNSVVLSTALEEEENFDNLLEVNQHTNKDAQEFIKRVPSKIVRRNFIPIEDLRKLQRVKTLKDFRREFKYNPLGKDVRRTMNYANDAIWLENVYCAPLPTPVGIPSPPYGIYYPDFVELHRCAGGCTSGQSFTHCVAKTIEEKNLIVHYVGYNEELRKRNVKVLPWEEKKTFVKRQSQIRLIKILNHTACECKCIVQASDCHSATEVYDEEICKCVCKNLSSSCNSSYQEWDNEYCHCKCKEYPVACEHNSKLWSPDTCKCDCLSKYKNRCDRKNKLLNHDTCECYCSPAIKCPLGKEMRRSDCKCV